MNLWLGISALLLLVFTIFFHEFVHWIALKRLGYNGKLITKGKYIFKTLAIKPIGVKENIVGAEDMLIVLYAPIWYCAVLFSLVFIIADGEFSFVAISLGIILSFVASIKDIKHIIDILIWWKKPLSIRRFKVK
jgi:hypothetical protein